MEVWGLVSVVTTNVFKPDDTLDAALLGAKNVTSLEHRGLVPDDFGVWGIRGGSIKVGIGGGASRGRHSVCLRPVSMLKPSDGSIVAVSVCNVGWDGDVEAAVVVIISDKSVEDESVADKLKLSAVTANEVVKFDLANQR